MRWVAVSQVEQLNRRYGVTLMRKKADWNEDTFRYVWWFYRSHS
jgi:hypothetical protein